MKVQRNTFMWLLVLVVAVAVLLGSASSGLIQAREPSGMQQVTCSWKSIGNSTMKTFHVGSAMDTDADKFYAYAGVDKNYDTDNMAEVGDVSAPSLTYKGSTLTVSGAMSLVGPAGAYRAKGAGNDASAVWFFGGANDWVKGQGGNDVQRYTVKSGKWDKFSVTGFTGRFFAAAAYDLGHDVIWVVGGVTTCKLNDILPPSSKVCQASNLDTYYITFDPTTGDPKVNTLVGGTQRIFGHTLVYDPTAKRLLMYGGTGDLKIGSATLKSLDLTDPDPAKAKWTTVTTSGTAPQVYFHGASFDVNRNWMVIYGGVKKDFMQDTEQDVKTTMALDLSQTPPKWTDLRPTGDPGYRIGAAMGFDRSHGASIITLGRTQMAFKSPSPATPTPEVPNVVVQISSYALECTTPGPTTPVPPTVTKTPTITPTVPTPTPSITLTPSPTFTPTNTRPPTMTPTPSATPTITDTPTVTPSPTSTPAPAPPDIYLPLCLKDWDFTAP
jgi:hypothetical protein